MDFITGLPIVEGKDYIYVVVDRLTRYAHFLAISTRYTDAQIAELFFREIFRLHGLPHNIVSDKDSRFLGGFWQELFSRAPKAKDWIQKSQDILKALKDNLVTAQNQLKVYADQHQTERHFEEGDLVYLQLQSYKKSTLKQKGVEKLQPRFYGPY
eukprot:PITA_33903